MAHNKVYGFCDSGCKVEVDPKGTTLPIEGGAMNGYVEFDTSDGKSKGFRWTTKDGTIFELRPYNAGNTFQITWKGPNDSAVKGAFTISNSGIVSLGNPLPIRSGGTDATDAATARTKLGAAAVSHTHTKSQITDFPDSMPASDVPSWAKEPAKPTYTAADVGALPKTGGELTGNVSVKKSDPYFYLNNTDTGNSLGMHWYKNGDANTFGIYDVANGKHLMLIEQDGTIKVLNSFEFSGTQEERAAKGKKTLKNMGMEIQVGVIEVGTSGAQLTFPEAFSGVPVVTANSSKQTSVRIHSITETGCTLVSGEASSVVQWQAVYIAK